MPAQHEAKTSAPPYNRDAERALLGAIFLENRVLPEVSVRLQAEHFYGEGHRHIYRAMLELMGRNEAIDVITIVDALNERDLLEAVGGDKYLLKLSSSIPSATNASFYATIIERHAARRAFATECNALRDECLNEMEDFNGFMEDAQRRIERLTSGYHDTQNVYGMASHVKEAFGLIESWQMNPNGHLTGVDTGFEAINERTLGWQRGDLVVLGARPGMGKTALALGTALACARSGEHAMFFSLEMSAAQLAVRALAHEAWLDQQRIRKGWLTEQQWALLIKMAGEITELPLHVDDTPGLQFRELVNRARQRHQRSPLRLIVVDYLTLLKHKAESHTLAVTEMAQGLKNLAKELDCTVICLAQLSREVEKRADKRPLNADLRDSGGIEQAADLICFLYREAYYQNTERVNSGQKSSQSPPIPANPNEAELNFSKFRNGETGVVRLGWRGECTRFTDMTQGTA